MMDPASHKFIFLSGLHRSGTSPLFKILREHPAVSGFHNTGVPEDEGQHLQSVIPPASQFGGPGRFGFSPEAHLTESSALVTPENRQKLFREWSPHWDLAKPFLIEKSPPTLIRSRFFQTLFPDSSFIVLIRHPIAVSLATAKWVQTTRESLVQHWVHCHRLFEEDRPHLRRVQVIRYEDLVQNTAETLNKICGFLGLTPIDAHPLNADGNKSYFEQWSQLSLDESQAPIQRRIAANYQSDVGRYGYHLLNEPLTSNYQEPRVRL